MRHQYIAIIDIGSNSIRLVIYKVNESGFIKVIKNIKIPAKLASYITNEGVMNAAGIERLLSNLTYLLSVIENYNIHIVKATATAAIRNATNRKEIEKAMNYHSRYPIHVLTEEEEAYYGYLAVVNSTNIKDGITIDIGGASTEVTLFRNRELVFAHSFPFGALSLKNIIKKDKPTNVELVKLKAFVHNHYSSLPWLNSPELPVIGIGGSARTLARIHQKKMENPSKELHQYKMTKDDVDNIFLMLTKKTTQEMQKLKGVSKDRADSITPAVIAIQQLIQFVGTNTYVVSKNGLREGLLTEILLKQRGI